MTTTRTFAQWTASGRPALDTLTAVAGDHAKDYDLEGAEADYLSRINMSMPPGFHMAHNGELLGPADSTWIEDNFVNPEEVDLLGGIEDIDVHAILERHEHAPKSDFERAQQVLLRFVDDALPYLNPRLAEAVRRFRALVEKGEEPFDALDVAFTFENLIQSPDEQSLAYWLEIAAERFTCVPEEGRDDSATTQLDTLRNALGDAAQGLYYLRKAAR